MAALYQRKNDTMEHCFMSKMNSFKPNKPVRGFTLIELLVVIAIIGILSALLLPVFSKAKNRGSQVTDLNDLKEKTTAINLYCSDHDDIIPWPNWDGGNYDRQGWLYAATAPDRAGCIQGGDRIVLDRPAQPQFPSARWIIQPPSLTEWRASNKFPATR